MSKKTYSLTLDLSEEYLKAIGLVTAHWSLLEFWLGRSIAELLGTEIKAGRILTTPISAMNLIETFRQLVQYRDPEGLFTDEMKEVIRDLNGAREKRRLVVHGVWGAYEKDQPVILQYYGKSENRILAKPHPMTVEDINNIAKTVLSVTNGFVVWWDGSRDVLVPSRNISPEPTVQDSDPHVWATEVAHPFPLVSGDEVND